MPATYFHVVTTLIVFIPVLLFLRIFSWELLALIAAFGAVIDFDHLIYFSNKLRTFDLRKIMKEAIKDLKIDNAHFYPFHTIEFFVAFFVLLAVKNFDIISTLVFSAAFLHWIVDGFSHYINHRNFTWLRYYSTFYHYYRRN